jgi:hypothetical protein
MYNNIIFECSDHKRDTGLLLLQQKKDPNKFELHLHNDYINNAIAMVLSKGDLQRMFESLEDHFVRDQIQQQQETC